MPTLTEASEALTEVLTDSCAIDSGLEIGEALADLALDDGIIKDIPILGTIRSLYLIADHVRGRLFERKLAAFLKDAELWRVSSSKRASLIAAIDGDPSRAVKVGEKLLAILDKCEDHEYASAVATLFAAFLREELNYQDFLRAVRGIQSMLIDDLKQFVTASTDRWDPWDAQHHLVSGFGEFEESEIRVSEHYPVNSKDPERFDVRGGELAVSISKLGKQVRAVLLPRFSS